MLPSLSAPYSAYKRIVNSKLVGDGYGSLSTVFKGFYFFGLALGKFGIQVAIFSSVKRGVFKVMGSHGFGSIERAPSLFIQILNVVSICAKKQMVRIYTQLVVALVKHKKALCDFSIVNYPRITVRRSSPLAPFFPGMQGHGAIVSTGARRPYPTLSQLWAMLWNRPVFIHLFPKALLNWFFPLNIAIVFFRRPCNRLGRFFHNNSMTELSRFRLSLIGDGVFIMSQSPLLAIRKWGGLSQS